MPISQEHDRSPNSLTSSQQTAGNGCPNAENRNGVFRLTPLGPENSLHLITKKHRAELGPVRFYKLVFTKEY